MPDQRCRGSGGEIADAHDRTSCRQRSLAGARSEAADIARHEDMRETASRSLFFCERKHATLPRSRPAPRPWFFRCREQGSWRCPRSTLALRTRPQSVTECEICEQSITGPRNFEDWCLHPPQCGEVRRNVGREVPRVQRAFSTSGLTGLGGRRSAKKAIRLSAARWAIASRVGRVALAMCGVNTTFGKLNRPG